MGKVFFDVAISLDGIMAPDAEYADDKAWWDPWMQIVGWVFPQRFFRENLKLGEGGETGQENDVLQTAYDRTGASIMGMNMFHAGMEGWPEEPPFHTPVYVLTHEQREPLERPGGTTFHFVNDGIDAALMQAKEAAGEKDVRIAGGVDAVQQYLNAGLVDELTVHVASSLLGRGLRLFDGVDHTRNRFELTEALQGPNVAHLTYRVSVGD